MMNSEYQLRREIVDIGKKVYHKSFVTATDGNISARLLTELLLVTPSGCCLGELKPEQLLCVDLTGKIYSGKGTPTSELPMHLAVYRERLEVNAVIHAHPPITTGITIAGQSLAQCVIPEVVIIFGTIPTTNYATPGTTEGAEAIKDLIKNHDAIILDRHGTLTVGENITDAYYKLEKVEYCARVTLTARLLGKVRLLSKDEIQKLDAVRKKYGYDNTVSLCQQCGVCLSDNFRQEKL